MLDAVTERKCAILVVGMHRSGTSAMARVLSLAGAALPAHVMGASLGNPTGHWEPQRVADYNDHVFAELDTGWDDPFGPRRRPGKPLAIARFIDTAAQIVREDFGGAPLIVLKDPRISRLIDLWEPACRQAGYDVRYVVMVRRPDAVAASLATRDGMNRNRGLLLWTSYMASTELATRDARRHFVRYEDLLDQPEVVLDTIEDRLDIVFPHRSWASDEAIRAFVKPDMDHAGRTGPLRLGPALAPVGSLYAHLASLASGIPGNSDVPDEVRTWLSALGEVTAPILAESAVRLVDMEHGRGHRESEITARYQLELAERQAQLEHHVHLAEAGVAEIAALKAELGRVSAAAAEQVAGFEEEIAATKRTHSADLATHQGIAASLRTKSESLRIELDAAQNALEEAMQNLDLSRSQSIEQAETNSVVAERLAAAQKAVQRAEEGRDSAVQTSCSLEMQLLQQEAAIKTFELLSKQAECLAENEKASREARIAVLERDSIAMRSEREALEVSLDQAMSELKLFREASDRPFQRFLRRMFG